MYSKHKFRDELLRSTGVHLLRPALMGGHPSLFSDGMLLNFGGGSFGLNPFDVPNSIRFNDDDSPKMARTLTLGNRRKGTFSTWVKRGNLGSIMILFNAGAGQEIRFTAANKLEVLTAGLGNLVTTAVYRDPHAYMHIVVGWDTDQATGADRIDVEVNGIAVTAFDTAVYPTINTDLGFGNAVVHTIGANELSTEEWDGYLAQTAFINGTKYAASNFGAFDTNGTWRPINISSLTYGAEGSLLDYSVAPGTGNGAGTDVSGNANHFTDSGLTASDQVPDSPTLNYCTLDSIDIGTGALSDGNLIVAATANRRGTIAVSEGKWAWKVTLGAAGSNGIINVNGTETLSSDANADVVEFELDISAGTLKKRVNGGALTSVATGLSGTYFPLVKINASVDFGQLGFSPTDSTFKTINTQNLVTPVIKDASEYVGAKAYTGTGASLALTFGGNTALDMSAGSLAMIKDRDTGATNWVSSDTTRGVTKELRPSVSDIETTDAQGIKTFDSGGLTVGTAALYNPSGGPQILWGWAKGATPGFDIVSYTGNGATTQTIAHNLGVVPKFIIVKNLDVTRTWTVYHEGIPTTPEGQFLFLNQGDAAAASTTVWNNTKPTSTVFSVGNNVNSNESGSRFIAYVFAEVEGFSRLGVYKGNASADGPVVWCGFKPALLIIKNVTASGRFFHLRDKARSPINPTSIISSFTASTETDSAVNFGVDMLATGFKVRGTDGDVNANAQDHIFMAWSDTPFGGDASGSPASVVTPGKAA